MPNYTISLHYERCAAQYRSLTSLVLLYIYKKMKDMKDKYVTYLKIKI
jgi:hypothetical protein